MARGKQIFMQSLLSQGVRYIFGNPGTTETTLIDALEDYPQIAYILAQGWTPAIEHTHPSESMQDYWTMWKLPFFGAQELSDVVSELEACHRAYPGHHVRLTGYDNYTQSQGSCFVVYEGRG
jgi:ribulose-bisphosphate carboxylase small chain